MIAETVMGPAAHGCVPDRNRALNVVAFHRVKNDILLIRSCRHHRSS